MKLTEIILTNFRQFKGEQHFPLQTTPDGRSVTLLFGANGAGKTTFLNAFTWALYGQFSKDVEEQDRLITDSVWHGAESAATIMVAVEVRFEHEARNYRARRSASVRKSSDEQQRVVPELQLWVTDPQGLDKLEGAPQSAIDSILPMSLSRFFFFNGERIDKLVSRRAYAEVKQDIKVLLGLEQVERALDHLPKAERKLSADLRRHGGGRAVEIQEAVEKEQDRLAELRVRQLDLTDSIATFSEERENVLDLLRQHEGAGPVQRQRDTTQTALVEAEHEFVQLQSDQRQLIGARGFLAFAGPMADVAESLAWDLHERGSLPAPLKREFVDGLLDEHRCICGTDLEQGTASYRCVQEWRDKAGLADVEAAWQRLAGEVAHVRDARVTLSQQLQSFAEDLRKTRDRITRLEEQATELDGQLKALPLEEVGRLEGKREDLDRRLMDANQSLGVVNDGLGKAEAELASLRGQLRNAEVGDELAQKSQERLQLVQSVEEALNEILTIRASDMRVRLDAKVKQLFAEITVKPYFPALSEDFELGLYQEQPDGQVLPVPKSTGENQILSLSFVAAVSQLAREVSAERREPGDSTDWGTYPIVMDAAFGSLDVGYQRDVSRALARLAPQMIVLVSKSQGMGQVFDELNPYVGNLGVITAHSTNKVQSSELIELRGRSIPYVTTNETSDWAELIEVTS